MMIPDRFAIAAACIVTAAGLAGCGQTPLRSLPASNAAAEPSWKIRSAYGIGPTVQPKVPGEILGFDIDQHGNDGVFANYQDLQSGQEEYSVETFDQRTGKITKVAKKGLNQSYAVEGVLAGDIGFLIDNHDFKLMNPVKHGKINGSWTPPITFYLGEIAENQSTSTQLMYGLDGSQASEPSVLIVADIATGTSKVIGLDQNLFNIGEVHVIAQDSTTNQGVIAAATHGGSRGSTPVIGIVDLKSGKIATFSGQGFGDVNGIGVDSKTGVACTTTEIDAGVEFYNLRDQSGFEVLLPNSYGSQIHSGSTVAVDSRHGLCIVAQPVSGNGTQASAIWVSDEKGHFSEEITGFNFWYGAGLAINPAKRIGYVLNPRPDYTTLTGFSY